MKTPRRLLLELVDRYIIAYHSDRYIDRELIQPEITRRIAEAVALNNTIRDEQEKARIAALKLEHEIKEKGWCSEIDAMHAEMQKTMKMREDVLALYYRVYQRAKELAMVTAENKHEGSAIINAVASSIGRLDSIGAKSADILQEMDASRERDMNALRIR